MPNTFHQSGLLTSSSHIKTHDHFILSDIFKLLVGQINALSTIPLIQLIPDISKPFFVNGMEIDLGELEQFEKRLATKRQNQPQSLAQPASTSSTTTTTAAVDELDEYLDRLAIDLKERDAAIKSKTEPTDCDNDKRSLTNDTSGVASCVNDSKSTESNSAIAATTAQPTSLPLLLFGFFSILFFIQSVISNRKQFN